MDQSSKYSINTLCVQGGYTPGNGEPRQIPIVQSTTFKYDSSDDMGKLFDLQASGYFYSRLQNPTCDTVAAKITELEGGTAGMLTGSGQAANFFALFNICNAGDHIVSSSSIYGGTFNLISVTMAKMGITATFVSPDCTEEELNAAFQPNTKAVFGETIANPALTVLDIEKFANAAHAHGVPLIVDNTFATPVNCRPIEWGADIVTHSTTKYMDGHGATLGGAIVDGGKFDWMAHADKFPGLCTPDDSYHGITYAEHFGKEGAFITKATAQLMRDFGCVQSPINAYMLNLGLGGYTPGNGEPRQIPIVQSTTFKYDSSDDMGKLFDLQASGYFYSRLQNPTCDTVAAKITELEGGTAGMLTGSGQAANFFALFNICNAGDHIVSSSSIYGGTFNLISVTMAKMGITATFVSPDCTEEELNAAFQPNTKAVFGETIANPALTVLDIEKFANAAHAHGVPLIVDNTFATPVNCRPIEWGADIVTHSTTKYMDGHGATLGGAIVDGGKFDWMAHADKFPGLCTPDDSYHGITYAEHFGKEGAFITKATAQLMRDFGCVQSPINAYMLNLGLESLHVRMARHCENGQAVAEFLASHPKIAYVNYCGLPGDKYHAVAEKYLPNGSCGVVSFGVKGGREAAAAFMGHLKIAAIETHVADARTCCLHPASSTHRQMNDEQLIAAGVQPDLVRMSCGLEDKNDLIHDIAQALDQI